MSTERYGYAADPVAQPNSLFVPRSALLMAGKNSIVYVESEPGRFEIRPVTLGPLLRDRAIIVDGLEPGERVATAGNFLIDSQMQLAGKPSLIDPTRAIAKRAERNEPLGLPNQEFARIDGEVGKQLSTLYQAYFRIQAALASDKRPADVDALELHQASVALDSTSDAAAIAFGETQFVIIAKHSEHLHHLDIDKARHEAFPSDQSHAVVTLASFLRAIDAQQSFIRCSVPW